MLSYLFLRNRARLKHLGRKHSKTIQRNYVGGRDILDPQYAEYPPDISPHHKQKYFDPVLVTDAQGRATEWLERYRPIGH